MQWWVTVCDLAEQSCAVKAVMHAVLGLTQSSEVQSLCPPLDCPASTDQEIFISVVEEQH